MSCQCCKLKSDSNLLCSGCNVGVYCGKKCQKYDSVNHAALCSMGKEVFWENKDMNRIIYEAISDPLIRNRIGRGSVPKQLRREIASDLFINGKLFETYMKAALSVKSSRNAVAKKLNERGSYFGAYTEVQKEQIKDIVESNPEKYDPKGEIRSALLSPQYK